MNIAQMQQLSNGAVNGIKLKNKPISKVCDICVKAKMCKKPFYASSSRANDVLELIHSDLCEMPQRSLGNKKYICTFIDDKSRKVFVYFLNKKSYVKSNFVHFKNYVENQLNKKIKVLRTDRGREYFNEYLKQFCSENGIQQQSTVPGNSASNGRAERVNRSLVEKAIALLTESGMAKVSWGEAVAVAAHILNHTPKTVLNGLTPEEVWTGKKQYISHFRIFGCKAYAHIQKGARTKLDPKAKQCRMLGFANDRKAYRLWDIANKQVIIAPDVTFKENQYSKDLSDNYKDNFNKTINYDENDKEDEFNKKKFIFFPMESDDNESNSNNSREVMNDAETTGLKSSPMQITPPADSTNKTFYQNLDDVENSSDNDYVKLIQPEPQPTISLRRSARPHKKKVLDDYITYSTVVNKNEPQSYEEAVSCAELNFWLQAMKDEYSSILQNNTWTLTDLVHGKNLITSRWIFRRKRHKFLTDKIDTKEIILEHIDTKSMIADILNKAASSEVVKYCTSHMGLKNVTK